jgi:hypothetical protein
MKKISITIIAVAMAILFAVPAMAAVSDYNNNKDLVAETLTLAADDAAVSLSDRLVGLFLYTVEIFTSADDAVTFSISSEKGTVLFTTTTTAATSGEIKKATTAWPITGTPKYTLSGLGAGTAIIVITGAK